MVWPIFGRYKMWPGYPWDMDEIWPRSAKIWVKHANDMANTCPRFV